MGLAGWGPRRGTRRGAGNTGSHHRVSVTGLVAGAVPDRAARARQGGSHTLRNACRLDGSGLPGTLLGFELLIFSLQLKTSKLVGCVNDLLQGRKEKHYSWGNRDT